MSDYGEGRHGYQQFRRPTPAYEQGRATPYAEPDRSGFFPRIDETDPRQPIGAPIREPEPRYQDLIVPRIYVEPDEQIDELRVRAYRIAMVRDLILIVFLCVGIFYLSATIFSWGR